MLQHHEWERINLMISDMNRIPLNDAKSQGKVKLVDPVFNKLHVDSRTQLIHFIIKNDKEILEEESLS